MSIASGEKLLKMKTPVQSLEREESMGDFLRKN
jgi:hypothetical protein